MQPPINYRARNSIIDVFQYGPLIRVSSKIFNFISGPDKEKGLDIFLPIEASDAELGDVVKRCFDASRPIDIEDFPKPKSAAESRKWQRDWEKIALDKISAKSVSEIADHYSFASSCRFDEFFLFSNCMQVPAPEYLAILGSKFEHYQEFIVPISATDEEVGHAVRQALSACVRINGAKPRPKKTS